MSMTINLSNCDSWSSRSIFLFNFFNICLILSFEEYKIMVSQTYYLYVGELF